VSGESEGIEVLSRFQSMLSTLELHKRIWSTTARPSEAVSSDSFEPLRVLRRLHCLSPATITGPFCFS